MSKVLVTGADGFIGSHLVELLLREGYEVKAFCFYNSNSSWGWLDNLPSSTKSEIEVVLGDIRDSLCVKEAMRGCQKVFHLAALIGIPYSYVAPASYVDTNIHGTLNVIQSARDLDISRVVHTSTSETYGSAQFVPITESHPLVAQSPYAATKIAADQIALSYSKSFGTPVTVLRPFNTYGPRQSLRAVIPTIISQFLAGEKKLKLGSLSPTRDFNYVLDTCEAFIAVSETDKTIGKVINAASNFEISIEDTVKIISNLMNAEIDVISDSQRVRPEKSEVNRLFGDNSLIKQLSSWEPKYSGEEGFKRGLELTINWFTDKSNTINYRNGGYTV